MMLRIKMIFVFAALFKLIIPVNAQENTTSFSMEEAMNYAMKNSYVLQNTSYDVNIAQKKVWETITTGLPQVSGSSNYNAFLNLPVSLLPGEFFGEPAGTYIPVKFGQDFNSDFGFSVNQLLFDGSYIVGVGSSQIYLNLAKQAHEKTQIDIREAVMQAYYLVLISERTYQVMSDNYENEKKIYYETQILYENGFREEQDVDQINLLLRNAENEMLKAERELKIAKVVLKYAMGYNLENEIQLTDELNKFVDPLVNKQNTLQFSSNNHIDYRLAVTNFQVSEKLLLLEKSAYLPRLSGFYNYSKSAYGNNWNLFKSGTEWYPSSLVGLTLTMDIFNSGQKRAKVQQAKMEVEKADNQLKLAEITLQKDYLTAAATMENALESFKNDQASQELAIKIKEKTKIKFDNGMSTSTELAQIETQYINAYRALVGSTLQLLQADISLKKAIGNL
ncbi:MAG: TolC family protein [Prolixibacteraceae bacterium]|nr:TolC family protein [Prolixibacteraceae bacterium]